MDKPIPQLSWRNADNFRQRRSAFSLTELVVSVAILSVMVLLAGEVMNLTVKSTGQATALSKTMQRLRLFEQTLREDLRYVQPGRSVMVIQGNPINAYWKKSQRDSDVPGNGGMLDPTDDNAYPHSADAERQDPYDPTRLIKPRADMLMFFTARPGTSFVDPTVTSGLQQVVIGHARLGNYVFETGPNGAPADIDADRDGGPFRFEFDQEAFPVDPENGAPSSEVPSPVPAEFWHLARRATLLLAPPQAFPAALGVPQVLHATDPKAMVLMGTNNFGLKLLRGQWDVVDNFNFTNRVLVPEVPVAAPMYLPSIFNTTGVVDQVGMIPFQRSHLDPSPPALYADRLGAYMLPNCASFKVEWALDPRSKFVGGRLDGENEIYWIDQGDEGNLADPEETPPNPFRALAQKIEDLQQQSLESHRVDRLEDLLGGNLGGNEDMPYTLAGRFRDDFEWRMAPALQDRTNTAVFTASRLDAAGRLTPEDVFPKALRITVDVFDDERRLDRPIRHVMVIPIGG